MGRGKRIHSFKPVVFDEAKVLILGTMPSIKSLDFQEYYGNKQNVFWKILFSVFREEYSDVYKDKLDLLQRNRIALWDVLQSCERKSSLDSDIIAEKANDIKGLLIEYPHIDTIVFSSQKARQYFDKYIGQIEGVSLLTLPSPSGANARMSFEEKLAHWQELKNKV
ncbi:DNA-deoxyinosine glycosylase [Myroides sp. LoEW2-1]|uniref:DNA-deoxyinosine glycosylase n=1 Tax=Myroides sp. LoEW2-1 TaxID=2683192 RepID=UPI0013206744|nr:DNA-deoxyinosine glycosylase [Myroides sp. LoEW2-1]MVX34781.1 DNA-deoxyinosine glycosylase [Myroides sp. LoEW2-1]